MGGLKLQGPLYIYMYTYAVALCGSVHQTYHLIYWLLFLCGSLCFCPQICHDSCPTQAWSIGCILEVLHDMEQYIASNPQ